MIGVGAGGEAGGVRRYTATPPVPHALHERMRRHWASWLRRCYWRPLPCFLGAPSAERRTGRTPDRLGFKPVRRSSPAFEDEPVTVDGQPVKAASPLGVPRPVGPS